MLSYNASMMMLAATIQSKILDVIPLLLTYVCFGMGLGLFLRCVRMIRKRYYMRHEGLHASSAVLRHKMNGEAYYLPVFSYSGAHGEVLDIMGEESYATEAEALQAHRPPVYADERPDAGVERSSLFLFVRPLVMLLCSLLCIGGMVASMMLMLD